MFLLLLLRRRLLLLLLSPSPLSRRRFANRVDRYFSFSLAVDMSLSLVSFLSRQARKQPDRQPASDKRRKRSVTDQNYQKLRLPISANDDDEERKGSKKILLLFCLLHIGERSSKRETHAVAFSCYSKVKREEGGKRGRERRSRQQNGHEVIWLIFLLYR